MDGNVKLKLRSIARRAGLADTPKPVLACLGVVTVLLLGFALWRFWPAGPASAGHDFSVSTAYEADDASGQEDALAQDGGDAGGIETASGVICVDVEGAVRNPGLYELEAGSRVGDAVKAAGGITKKAVRGQVNLAAALQDGQQVMVPSKQDAAVSGGQAQDSAAVDVAAGGSGDGDAQGKININTASATQLQQLSGIGESLSQRIVDYRNANGAFGSVDDLTKVSGIGDARLESIRAQICV